MSVQHRPSNSEASRLRSLLDAKPRKQRRSKKATAASQCRYHSEAAVCDQCRAPVGELGFPRAGPGVGRYRLCPACNKLVPPEDWGHSRYACSDCTFWADWSLHSEPCLDPLDRCPICRRWKPLSLWDAASQVCVDCVGKYRANCNPHPKGFGRKVFSWVRRFLL